MSTERTIRKAILSEDTLLLLVTVGLQLVYVIDPSIHAFPLVSAASPAGPALGPVWGMLMLMYCGIDVSLKARPRLQHMLKNVLLVLLVGLITVAPLIATMVLRARTEPHRFAHDGLIQVEAAMEALGRGENPYEISYRDTPMALWPFREEGLTENPAMEHLIYLPAAFTIPWPFYALADSLGMWYDHRWFHLLAFLACCLAAAKLLPSGRWRSLVVILSFSPLLLPFFLEGRNDIVIVGWLFLTTLALQRDRPVLGVVFLAVASASKATAWLAVPFFAALVFFHPQHHPQWRKAALVFCLAWLVFVIPFFLWSPSAFVEDTLLYQAGHGVAPYPIKGFGLGQLLLSLGLIEHSLVPFPFWLFQLGIGVPVLVLLVQWIRRRPSIGRAWLGFGFFLAIFGFFGRVFNDNHLGIVGILLIIGYLLEREADG